jgi:acyl carrier protein
MKSIPPDSGIRVLERLAESGDVQAVVWPPDWEHWARTYPSFARTSLIAHLLGRPDTRPVEPARITIPSSGSEIPEAERALALRTLVTREISAQLRIAVEDLPLDTPLERLGFDSLLATELQARLIADLAVRIPILRLLGFATARTIADEVAAAVVDSERRLKAATPVSEGPSHTESAAPNVFRRFGS